MGGASVERGVGVRTGGVRVALQLLGRQPEMNHRGGQSAPPPPPGVLAGHIVVTDVHFSYPSRSDTPVRSRIS
jgi:hypothetical protein